jgi:hypothetical protein
VTGLSPLIGEKKPRFGDRLRGHDIWFAELIKLEAILAEMVAQCSDGDTHDCPVLDILDAGRPTD